MTHVGVLGYQRPIAAPLVKKESDFFVQGVFGHAPILGKFSSKSKEHFTRGLGHSPGMTDDSTINRVLARNLAYWMGEAKLTQAALAEKAGVSQKTISNYLNPGQRAEGSKGKEPSAKLTELDKIAEALHIGVWQLLREMTASERRMYQAIENHYASLRDEVEAAVAAEPHPEDVKLFNQSRSRPAKPAQRKRAA